MANKYAARKMFDEGVAAYVIRDFKKSVNLLTRAIKYDPTLALFYVSRGAARLKLEKALDAVTDFNRAIDLDLILWGAEIIDTPRLVVPHPEAHRRRFVLQPLADVAAELSAVGLRVVDIVGDVAGEAAPPDLTSAAIRPLASASKNGWAGARRKRPARS